SLRPLRLCVSKCLFSEYIQGTRIVQSASFVLLCSHETENIAETSVCRFQGEYFRPSASDHGRNERVGSGAAGQGRADSVTGGQPPVHHSRYPSHCLGRPAEKIRDSCYRAR